jgi:hypothetical protein
MNRDKIATFLVDSVKDQGVWVLDDRGLDDVVVDGVLDFEQLADDLIDALDYHA